MINKLKLTIFFTALIIAAYSQGLNSVDPQEVGMSSERLSFLDQNLNEYVEDGELSGAAIMVLRKGKVAYQGYFGDQDMERDMPITERSIYRIASQTKAIVSVAIMILQEEGKLLISDPLSKYIPEFKESTVAVANEDGSYDIVPAKREIRLRDLLTHTAGIGYGYGPGAELWQEVGIQGWYFAHRDEPIVETVRKMAALPNEAHPGEQYVYGYNTDILGAVVELVSEQTLSEFITERILDPLDMGDTHFYLPPQKAGRLAKVYAAGEEGLSLAPDESTMIGQGGYINGPRKSYSGGAGLLSTTEDYATFLQMMLNGGTYGDHRILSQKSVELMTVNHLGTVEFPWAGGVGFGLGFSVVEDLGARGELGSEGEYGWGGAYHSVYWVDPAEELVVVYFTQLIPAGDIDDHQKIRALIYQAIED